MTGLERLRNITDGLDRGPWLGDVTRALYDTARQIESEHSEDHEIAEWVRDNGGIDLMEDQFKEDNELQRIVVHALWPDGVPETGAGNEQIADELGKRLMPPGYEWPRFEDGEKASEGDEYECWCGETHVIRIISLRKSASMINQGDIHCVTVCNDVKSPLYNDYRLKRPKQGPIGADGLPIKKDEITYLVSDGREAEVRNVSPNGVVEVVARRVGIGNVIYVDASQLTHTKPEPPDSWERIERDALNFVEDNAGIPHSQDQMERDILEIVRRAKALAERDKAE